MSGIWVPVRGCNVAFINLATSTMEQSVIGDAAHHRALRSEIQNESYLTSLL